MKKINLIHTKYNYFVFDSVVNVDSIFSKIHILPLRKGSRNIRPGGLNSRDDSCNESYSYSSCQ